MKFFTLFQLVTRGVIAAAVCAALIAPAQAKDPKPLFASDEVIQIRIEAPFRDLIRKAPNSTDPYPALLTLESASGEQHAIMLSARGNSRRDTNLCRFPPLRVAFNEKPDDPSLFDGQKRLKLVTHCRKSKSYQQYYLLEYAAYKLLNVLTPQSLNVRLAEITYVEAGKGKTIATRYGFFIEDTDDAAKRNGLKEIDIPDISLSQLNMDAAARMSLFQYMIGNLDWSMHNGPLGKDCCHNAKLIGDKGGALDDIIAVPYDFDYSGLVDTPYAIPPESVRVRNVRTRRYRGYCVHNEQVRLKAQNFLAQKQALLGVIENVPGLTTSKRNNAKRYMGTFFQNIADEKKLESRLLKYCRE